MEANNKKEKRFKKKKRKKKEGVDLDALKRVNEQVLNDQSSTDHEQSTTKFRLLGPEFPFVPVNHIGLGLG